MQYKNLASADHPATIIILVNISESMGGPTADGKTRIEVAKDAILNIYTTMVKRSLMQGQIKPRYRIGMVTYSDNLYDVYGDGQKQESILTIKEIVDQCAPSIASQGWTDTLKKTIMAKAFHYATHLIKEDIKTWPEKWLAECPSPMVINITDCEYVEGLEELITSAKMVRELSVPDGNVLIANIFINDRMSLNIPSPKDWRGYQYGEQTGDHHGDELLDIASPVPQSISARMRLEACLKVQEGSPMMYPGIYKEFITRCLPMCVTS